MVKELNLFGCYRVWIYKWDDMDEQEKTMVTELVDVISGHLALVDDSIPLMLELREKNCSKNKLTMHFKIAALNDEGVCPLGDKSPKVLFQTTATQTYKAENHDDPSENYDGVLSVAVVANGVWNHETKCHGPHNRLSTILKLACGDYYEKILEHYPEWTTYYKDSPLMVSVPTDHV